VEADKRWTAIKGHGGFLEMLKQKLPQLQSQIYHE